MEEGTAQMTLPLQPTRTRAKGFGCRRGTLCERAVDRPLIAPLASDPDGRTHVQSV